MESKGTKAMVKMEGAGGVTFKKPLFVQALL